MKNDQEDKEKAEHLWNARWKPASEAPRDGTIIDLWIDGYRAADCRWNEEDSLHEGGWEQRYAETGGSFFPLETEPTHFMLPPAPPAALVTPDVTIQSQVIDK